MKILVTGTEGYLGTLLGPVLMAHGHDVTGVDTGYYKSGCLYQEEHAGPRTLNKDIRRLRREDLEGFEAVVHMAELSNDPAGQLRPHITRAINHQGSVQLAKLAREAGAQRFVYTSSCSVYGVAAQDWMTEDSPVNPKTEYAICKVMVERDVSQLAAADFSPTFLRNATAYGASPRMRFDIVLNNLAGYAWTTKEIRMQSDGTPWRPLVHALDIAKAVLCTLQAPRAAVHNRVFNVGDTRQNYTVRQIAEVVSQAFHGCRLTFGTQGADNRSYRVAFERIHAELPGFACEWDAQRGAEQLRSVFERIKLSAETFQSAPFTRLKQLEHLLRTQQLDDDFFWSSAVVAAGSRA